MKNMLKSRSLRISAFVLVIFLVLGDVEADDGSVPIFTFDNSSVNKMIIEIYEQNPQVWQTGQLYLVGICYVTEGKLDNAQKIFLSIKGEEPHNAFQIRVLRALGQVHHMKSEFDKAVEFYNKAWVSGKDVKSLSLLALMKIQAKDFPSMKKILPDLLMYQKGNVDIQKALLAYSLMVEDTNEGGKIAMDVVRALNPDIIKQHKDLLDILIQVTMRYKDCEPKNMKIEENKEREGKREEKMEKEVQDGKEKEVRLLF
jgi:tetratricopeptide (TPR) repeat protein